MICIDRFDVFVCGRFAVKSAKMKEIVPRICRERVNPAQNKVVRWVKGANKNVLINFGGRITKKNQCFSIGGNYIGILPANKQKCILGALYAYNTSCRGHIFAHITHTQMHSNFGHK